VDSALSERRADVSGPHFSRLTSSALGTIRTPNLLIRSQIDVSAVLTQEVAGRPEAKTAELDALEIAAVRPTIHPSGPDVDRIQPSQR
jgi:hypothetical protein